MPRISPAHTILVRAQESVNRWSASDTQPNFALAMEAASWVYWSPSRENAGEREAFRQVAEAIHGGEGDVLTYPAELLRIAHAVLDQ